MKKMNKKEIKLDIIKRVLGTNKWYLRGDQKEFPGSIFVFDGDGNCIMELDGRTSVGLHTRLWCEPYKIWETGKNIFCYDEEKNKQLFKILMNDLFGWNKERLKPSGIGLPLLAKEVEEYFKTK